MCLVHPLRPRTATNPETKTHLRSKQRRRTIISAKSDSWGGSIGRSVTGGEEVAFSRKTWQAVSWREDGDDGHMLRPAVTDSHRRPLTQLFHSSAALSLLPAAHEQGRLGESLRTKQRFLVFSVFRDILCSYEPRMYGITTIKRRLLVFQRTNS